MGFDTLTGLSGLTDSRVEAVETLKRSLQDYRDTFGPPGQRAALLARLRGQRAP